jgi:tRNA splicing endonuclease
MFKRIENYLIIFGEELGKVEYSIVKAAANTFYKTKGELAAYTIDNYMNTRFEIRLEDFAFEQEKLTDKQKQNFYENINYKQLNFLFELLDKARTSTYDLHAKILAKLYGNLILNGNLDYHESTFLANINIMNDEDLLKFYKLLNEFFNKKGLDIDTFIMKQEKLEFETKTYTDIYIYDKLLRVGLIVETNLGRGADLALYSGSSKDFYIYSFTKSMYLYLKEILGDVK